MGIDFSTVASPCPYCGVIHDRAYDVTGTTEPSYGAITLCIKCGQWCIFKGTRFLTLHKPTEEEKVDIVNNPICQKIYTAWVKTQ